jgi:hypothetical protein
LFSSDRAVSFSIDLHYPQTGIMHASFVCMPEFAADEEHCGFVMLPWR